MELKHSVTYKQGNISIRFRILSKDLKLTIAIIPNVATLQPKATQIATALLCLLWEEYSKYLPDSDKNQETPQGAGTYTSG